MEEKIRQNACVIGGCLLWISCSNRRFRASEESYCKEPLKLVGNFIELRLHLYAQYKKMIQEYFPKLKVLFIEMDRPESGVILYRSSLKGEATIF